MPFLSLRSALLATLLLLSFTPRVEAKPTDDEVLKVLPKQVGTFRLTGTLPAGLPNEDTMKLLFATRSFRANADSAGARAEYVSADGKRFVVEVFRLGQDPDAYSFLTILANSAGAKITREVGTAAVVLPGSVSFFKGRTLVRVFQSEPAREIEAGVFELARAIAERTEAGEGDIPVLVKHLPQWEQAQERVVYLAGFNSLKEVASNQSVLDAVVSEGDADAVTARYGSSEFLLIEFNTPQLAADNDRNITNRIQQLKSQGQPVPSAYRRVGNYSVFVFNAESEQTATALIDQVKYEQVVQWLGENPNILERAQRDYYLTTAGVLIAVIKASGLSLLACLAIGGFLGTLLFTRRRAQQREAEAFSDAGGMLRLNIDEMTPEANPGKLLGPAK